jgi:hypothetical protein
VTAAGAPSFTVLAALALAAASCHPCERGGCDAYGRRAAATVREGVVGAVALLSDVIDSNGLGGECQECGFSTVDVLVWRTALPITTEDAARAAMAAPPTTIVHADRAYQIALGPGDHLLCASRGESNPPCAAFPVVAGEVTTVNVKTGKGLTSLLVFDPGATAARPETFAFSAP